MLTVTSSIAIPDDELEFRFIRAQGAGGQHVNKAATAVQLRFDIRASQALPEECKQRLLCLPDQRITENGVIVIKAQRFRSQDMNRQDAGRRLAELIRMAIRPKKKRRPTSPTRSSHLKRLNSKTKSARIKKLRGPVRDYND